MKKLNFSELAQELELISQEETKKITGGYWDNSDLFDPYGNGDYYSGGGNNNSGGTYNGGSLPEVTIHAWGPIVYLPIQNYVPQWGNWDPYGAGGGYNNPTVTPQPNVYDEIATIFGFGSAVHQGTGMLLSSKNAIAVTSQFFGPESVDALKATAQYVGKIASVTSRAAAGIGTLYSFVEIYNDKDDTHTWVNLGVTTASIGAEILFGAAAAPYLIVGGVAYGVFVLSGGNEWLDN
jgi:hypothetical protein